MLRQDKNIKLTIAIPTYNRARFLEKTLKNIGAEIDKIPGVIIEILVSNNGSNDKTSEVCEDFQKNYEHFSYNENQENLGYLNNFLKVLELAKGEFVWLMGDDDGIAKNGLQTILNAINNSKGDLYLGASYNSNIGKDRFLHIKVNTKIGFKDFFYVNILRLSTRISNYVVNKKLYLKYKEHKLNNHFPNIHLLLLALNNKENCFIISEPISLVNDDSYNNTIYSAELTIQFFTLEFIYLYNEIKPILTPENLKCYKNGLINKFDIIPVFLESAYLDNYYKFVKILFKALIKLPATQLKLKFIFLYILPNLVPFFLKRFFIKKIALLIKGKIRTNKYIKKLEYKKEVLNGDIKDLAIRTNDEY